MNNQDFYSKVIQTLSEIYHKKVEDDRLETAKITEFDYKEIRPLFPYKQFKTNSGEIQYQPYSCQDVCCRIEFGHYICGKVSPGDDEFNSLGIGISLYVKFICYLIFFFFLATLLVAAPLFLYYNVSIQNNSLRSDLNSVLYSSTIGTLSANLYQCKYALLQEHITMSISCKAGRIIPKLPIYTNQSFDSVEVCYKQYLGLNQNGTFDQPSDPHNIPGLYWNQSCSGSACNLSITVSNQNVDNLFVMVGYSCLNPEYKIMDYPINSKIILLVVVGVDLVVVLMFMVCVCLETKSENKLVAFFNKQQISVEDFTLELKGFKFNGGLLSTSASKFINVLTDFLNDRTKKGIVISKFKICDNVNKISHQYKKKQIYQQLFRDHFEKLLAEGKSPAGMTLTQFVSTTDFKKMRKNIEKAFSEFKKCLEIKNHQPESIFITFETPEMALDVLKTCKRSCFTGKTSLKIEDQSYQVQKAPRADQIQWENLNSRTTLRTMLSWFISLCILTGSYLMIAAAQIGQKQMLNNFNFKVNCGLLFDPSDLTTWSESLKGNKNWVNCYCMNNLSDIFGHSQCKSWLKNYSFYLFSPMFISLLIVIFNMIVSFIFKKLSKFQKHSNLCNQLYSYIIKRALLLILNAGFIIVIVNQKISVDMKNPFVDFLFKGNYDKFNAAWYYGIGQVIIFTNLFNIVMPIFEVAIQSILKCFLKLIDTKCGKKRTSMVSKQSYKSLYSGIPFPIEERYAEILSLVILTFAYNCVIPLLNLVALFSFMFQYITDKIMIYCIYKKPPNYDQNLQRMIRKTLILCIIVHLVASLFLLQTEGVDISSGLSFSMGNLDNSISLKSMMTQIYIYPYLSFLAMIIIWIIFRHTFVRLSNCFTKRCENKAITYQNVQKNSLRIYDLFDDHQINQLLRVNNAELIKTQDQEDNYNSRKAMNQTLETLMMNAAVKIIVNPMGEVETPADLEDLDEYKKILFLEKAQLSRRESKNGGVKLNGLPGYDPIFQKDNNIVEVSRFEAIVQEFYKQSNKEEA